MDLVETANYSMDGLNYEETCQLLIGEEFDRSRLTILDNLFF